MKKVLLQTTLAKLKDAGACQGPYQYLVECLGGTKADRQAPLNLLTILQHNGVEDALWALRYCEGYLKVARFMAADFAEDVLPIWLKRHPNDERPAKAIAAARRIGAADAYAAAAAAYAAAASHKKEREWQSDRLLKLLDAS